MPDKKQTLPPQRQDTQPGQEAEMIPRPQSGMEGYRGAGKLTGKVALITGGDSGIGRAVAVAFAKEGADVAISYLSEHKDAQETATKITQTGHECIVLPGDVGDEQVCRDAVAETLGRYGHVDILVNNAAEQHSQKDIGGITREQLEATFRSNVYAMFYLVKSALPHLKDGACIINTTSVTAYKGSPQLLDYSATKGAIVAFTRSLSEALIKRGIRVNAVAPGPVWTPLIPSSFDEEKVSHFGSDVPMGRPGQPDEIAPCYVFLASDDSSYISGQVLHPNGGQVVNG